MQLSGPSAASPGLLRKRPSGSFTQTHTSPCTFPQNRPLVTVALGLSTSPHTRWYPSVMTVTGGLSPAPLLPRGPVPLRASLPCPEAWAGLGHCGAPDLLTSPLHHTSKPRSCHLECGCGASSPQGQVRGLSSGRPQGVGTCPAQIPQGPSWGPVGSFRMVKSREPSPVPLAKDKQLHGWKSGSSEQSPRFSRGGKDNCCPPGVSSGADRNTQPRFTLALGCPSRTFQNPGLILTEPSPGPAHHRDT